MTRSLLDTDILSEVMKGRDANVVRSAREYLAAHHRLTISAITVMEVSYGLCRAGRTEQLAALEAMLATIEVLPLGDAAGLLAGHILGANIIPGDVSSRSFCIVLGLEEPVRIGPKPEGSKALGLEIVAEPRVRLAAILEA